MQRTDRTFHRLAMLLLAVALWAAHWAAAAAPAHALSVREVRFGLHPEKTRMVVELSTASQFRVHVAENPWRLIVDLPTFDWQASQISRPTQSPVLAVRQGRLNDAVSRISVDLKYPVAVHDAFILRKSSGKPDRLVIDFSKTSEAAFRNSGGKSFGILAPATEAAAERPAASIAAAAPMPRPPAPKPPQEAAKATPASLPATGSGGLIIPERKPFHSPPGRDEPAPAPARQAKKPLIVLDPGHGGVDPGAIGANGVFEKHVAMAMAKELKSLLEATGRYEVALTRENDTYKRLYQRVDFARQRDADLFISIHADSIGKANVSGASIYTLSEKASDEQTALLADRENKADIIAGVDISHEDAQVANILIDLAMRDTMNQSKFFANTLVDALAGGGIRILEDPHRSAGFAVLKAPDIPSVLVEIGFMSNKAEAQRLSSADYRRNIAKSLVAGIDAYFQKVASTQRL